MFRFHHGQKMNCLIGNMSFAFPTSVCGPMKETAEKRHTELEIGG